MKKLMTVLALGAAMGFAGVAGAKDASDKPLKGKITSIKPDDDKKSTDLVVVHGKTKDEVTIVADDSATVTVDGNAAKLADLVVGEVVTVTPATGKPTTIVAMHAKKKKDAAAAAPAPTPAAPAPDAK
jgi:hypothetical protein